MFIGSLRMQSVIVLLTKLVIWSVWLMRENCLWNSAAIDLLDAILNDEAQLSEPDREA